MVLAKGLETVSNAVDVSEPLLADLKRRATEASLEHLMHTKCIAVADLPTPFQQVRRPSPIPHRRANGWMYRGRADLPGRCANWTVLCTTAGTRPGHCEARKSIVPHVGASISPWTGMSKNRWTSITRVRVCWPKALSRSMAPPALWKMTHWA